MSEPGCADGGVSSHGTERRYDAIVIGGGFAGLVAARDLADDGRSVVMLEARERLGGRTWTSTFPGTDIQIELGGHYVSRGKQPELGRELSRYGIKTVNTPVPQSFPTVLAGTRRDGPMPIPFEQIPALERAIFHCQQAASRLQCGVSLDRQDLTDLDVPLSDFLAPLGLPRETYEYVTAVVGMYLFRPAAEVSALHAMYILATYRLSTYSIWGAADEQIAPGTNSLASAIASDIPEIRLEQPVRRVTHDAQGVTVATVDGGEVSAASAVVAVPMNVWNDIEFQPPLSEAKRQASSERHGLRAAAKAWVRVRNAPVNPYAVAAASQPDGATLISTEATLDNGDQLMPMFGYGPEGDGSALDYGDPDRAARALEVLLPGAELVGLSSHDWTNDPYSRGAWVAYKPGRLARSHSSLQQPEGLLSFATSDIVMRWMLRIEGAIGSGHGAVEVRDRVEQLSQRGSTEVAR